MHKPLFQFISLFPDLINSYCCEGVIGRAVKSQTIEIKILNPREATADLHHTVDDRPFGGGDGMLGLAQPIAQQIETARLHSPQTELIYLSPQGEQFTDGIAKQWASQGPNLTLVCGRYGGIDDRLIRHYKIREISVGDYILSGGELAALVILDSVARKIPGVLGHADSGLNETFNNCLLEAPQFTRPRVWNDLAVPDILLSGDHKKIFIWKELASWALTWKKRPDLFKTAVLSESTKKQIIESFEVMMFSDLHFLGLNKQDIGEFINDLKAKK